MDEPSIRDLAERVAATVASRLPYESLVEHESSTESRPGFFGMGKRNVPVEKANLLIEGWPLWTLVMERVEVGTLDPGPGGQDR